MRPTILLAAAIVAAFAAGGGALSDALPVSAQATTTVQVGDFYFCARSVAPEACETAVSVGDTVVWDYNDGTVGHTVTHCGDSCNSPTDAPLFDSGGMAPADTFSFTFDSPGTYFYYCEFHPLAMRARVVVAGEATPTAAPTAEATAAPTGTPEPPPQPTEEPTAGATPTAAATPAPEDDDGGGLGTGAIVGIIVAAIAAALALAGGALYLRRRRV